MEPPYHGFTPGWYTDATPAFGGARDNIDGELGMQTFKRFIRDEQGATAIEYGLIAAGIAVVIIAVVNGIGTNLTTTFSKVMTSLQ